MKVSFTALSLFFLAAGCSVFDSKDDAEQHSDPAAPMPDRTEAPAPPPLQGTPKTSDLDESFGVFVVADAAPGGDGTRVHPFATIAEGIASATPSKKRVYVCEGSYRESIAITDGVSIVGGLDCSTATWSIGQGRSRLEATSIPAVTAKNVTTATRFSRFEVITPDATEPGSSSIALFASSAGMLTVDNVRLVAGRGGKGADGVDPQPASPGGDADGKLGPVSGPYCPQGAATCPSFKIAVSGGEGGTSACGAPAGGLGGTGGVWKSVTEMTASGIPTANWYVWSGDYASYGSKVGASGGGSVSNGTDGESAKSAGLFTREGFVPANGTVGTNGSPGRSGDGGAGRGPVETPFGKDVWYGVQGSGGGAGGCGGIAATEGKGGGASVAAFVVDGATSFVDSELASNEGGAGGKGSFGAAPTLGGKGGPAIAGAPSSAGQDGERGGLAGVSGSGAGGSSVALVHFGPKPSLERTKLVVGAAGSGAPAIVDGPKTIPASANGEATEIVGR